MAALISLLEEKLIAPIVSDLLTDPRSEARFTVDAETIRITEHLNGCDHDVLPAPVPMLLAMASPGESDLAGCGLTAHQAESQVWAALLKALKCPESPGVGVQAWTRALPEKCAIHVEVVRGVGSPREVVIRPVVPGVGAI